ncbi:hypothetical protein HELRODRAFT_181246 [Helobdella robusta]|uniref:Uncharacterized protein n=1 Tax=Helobdella robusta TaxID=6412 RepID=T1FGS5_HELRO|nr:hypothetical protein HELRODRAFT_181246 [Helobdella robusta]ESN93139.1 hypothetical protein HELRODRAFT_181246 [Helobdella robusta]
MTKIGLKPEDIQANVQGTINEVMKTFREFKDNDIAEALRVQEKIKKSTQELEKEGRRNNIIIYRRFMPRRGQESGSKEQFRKFWVIEVRGKRKTKGDEIHKTKKTALKDKAGQKVNQTYTKYKINQKLEKKFKILYTNADSLMNKRTKLEMLIDCQTSSPNVQT